LTTSRDRNGASLIDGEAVLLAFHGFSDFDNLHSGGVGR
jgi:hypothetical protein